MNVLHDLLAERGTLLIDGAMGTELFARGLGSGDPPEMRNVDHPDRVTAVHADYINRVFTISGYDAEQQRAFARGMGLSFIMDPLRANLGMPELLLVGMSALANLCKGGDAVVASLVKADAPGLIMDAIRWNKENAEALMSGFPRRAAALSPARALERAGAGPPGGGAVGAGDGVGNQTAFCAPPRSRSQLWSPGHCRGRAYGGRSRMELCPFFRDTTTALVLQVISEVRIPSSR